MSKQNAIPQVVVSGYKYDYAHDEEIACDAMSLLDCIKIAPIKRFRDGILEVGYACETETDYRIATKPVVELEGTRVISEFDEDTPEGDWDALHFTKEQYAQYVKDFDFFIRFNDMELVGPIFEPHG